MRAVGAGTRLSTRCEAAVSNLDHYTAVTLCVYVYMCMCIYVCVYVCVCIGSPPTGSLLRAIESDFGSVQSLQSVLSAASVGIQGSGWGWLGYNNVTRRLQIATRANQDPLLDLVPLLGIDVWEHAYYYLYGPARAEYLKNIWSVVNWKNVQERLDKAQSNNKQHSSNSK